MSESAFLMKFYWDEVSIEHLAYMNISSKVIDARFFSKIVQFLKE